MSNGLHLELDKKQIPGSTFSQGVLTLEKAGKFTVHITEYLELLNKRSKFDPAKGKTLVDSGREKEIEDLAVLSGKFDTVNWAWNTVYNYETSAATQNLFVAKGIPFDGKTFTFPEVLEGGGHCYVEAFFEGKSPVGKTPNGLLIRAIGTPKIIRVEWTDMQYNPIKDTKVAFGSHLLLHIYTQGLYGQEILVGLKDVKGLNKDLNIANSGFFEREVKTYPVQEFEKKHPGVSGLLVKSDNPKQAATTIQKAEIEVGIDFVWMLGQTWDVAGQYGDELQIETRVLHKTSGEEIPMEGDNTILNVSVNGAKKDFTMEITNKPVLVGEIDTITKDKKKPIDFTFGVFLDGTLNNMYDTEVRQLAEGKSRNDTTGLTVTPEQAQKIYKKKGDKKNAESSYENDLSNPAILFKNYLDDDTAKVFKIYTEGIGTNTAPKEQGADVGEKDYKKVDFMEGPAFGMGTAGIMDKVRKSILDAVKMIKANVQDTKQYCAGTITFDVFGFSRGAAAARHFVHVVTHGQYKPEQSYFRGEDEYVRDLQGNDVDSDRYRDKLMPAYGVLGQLLTEEELMDEALTQVNVRFVGIYDTVPHHGLFQDNDIRDLGLDNVNRARYVVHMIAADEYRANFSLVDISSVTKVSPYDGDKGGIELIYPGVHCDIGGAYVDGGGNHPRRINVSQDKEVLEQEKTEFVKQGWFNANDLSVEFYWSGIILAGVIFGNYYRLQGFKEHVSNQYSYIPLHFMAEFCELRDVPIKESKILKGYDFKSNFIDLIPNVKHKNIDFLEDVKSKLWEYTFRDGEAVTFERYREDVAFLRYYYLHWNATYGDPHEAMGTWLSGKNMPNMDKNGKRKRYVR